MHMESGIIGLPFLVVGIGYLGGAMDRWNFPIFFPGQWTLFLIILVVFSFFEDGFYFGNNCVFILGAYLLCSVSDQINIRPIWGVLVVIGSILLGRRMIIRDSFLWFKHSNNVLQEENGRRDLRSATYFGNKRLNVHGIVYSLRVEDVFGTQMIDLVGADLTECDYAKLEVVFGSIDLLVSDRIRYRVKSENVFGNIHVEHHPKGSQDLAVDVSCIFGMINPCKVHVEGGILNGKYREK